jgi:hypothetical protein
LVGGREKCFGGRYGRVEMEGNVEEKWSEICVVI